MKLSARARSAYGLVAQVFLAVVFFLLLLDLGSRLALYFAQSGSKGPVAFDSATGLPVSGCESWACAWFDLEAAGGDVALSGQVLRDFEEFRLVPDPWGEFVEEECQRPTLHVERSPLGFVERRCSARCDEAAVDCYGASCTFGWFVRDEDAWPARLGVSAHNLGHACWTPAQEVTLFAARLRAGIRPRVAIFMDGATGDRSEPGMRRRLTAGLEPRPSLAPWLADRPFLKLVHRFEKAPESSSELDAAALDEHEIVSRVLAAWREARALGREFSVPVVCCLQPDAAESMDERFWRWPRAKGPILEHRPIQKRIYSELRRGCDLDLSGLVSEWGRPVVLDNCHYTPAFADFLATRVRSSVVK